MTDRHIVPRVSKRGWRSGKPGSWNVNPNYQYDIRRGMTRAFPDHVELMANGAWQFFWMGKYMEWFSQDVPKPRTGETTEEWMSRVWWPDADDRTDFGGSLEYDNRTIEEINAHYKEMSDDNASN